MLVSVIFPAKNEGANVRNTISSLHQAATTVPYEALVVDDNSRDGCCSVLDARVITTPADVGACKARNLGAKYARGDVLLFCDAHLFFSDHWMDRLIQALDNADMATPAIGAADNPSALGYGQTLSGRLETKWNPRPAGVVECAIMPGGCVAIKRDAFNHIGGFDEAFTRWGHEDVELSVKSWLFGHRAVATPFSSVLHIFRPKHPYPVSSRGVDFNQLHMAYSHFAPARIAKVRALLGDPTTTEREVLASGVLAQRGRYLRARSRSDAGFFRRFNIPF